MNTLSRSSTEPTEKVGTSTSMQAAVIVAPGKMELREVPIPDPGPGQVRIKLEGCGVCSSNIPPWEGREWFSYPMEPGALGHEGWGVVDALGEGVSGVEVGDRVACLSYHAYAEYDIADAEAVVSINKTPFPGEPLGCAMNIFKRSQIREGDTVAVVGIGFLGSLLTRLASQAGARVIAIARKPYALEIAACMGAQETIPMHDHNQIIETVHSLTDGKLCDVVVEAVGKQWPLDLSAELAKERGRLVIAGYHQDGMRQVNMQLWNWRGLDVINAHERERQVYIDGIKEAIAAVEQGRLDPTPLFTHTFPLARLDEALEMTRERPEGFMKALVLT